MGLRIAGGKHSIDFQLRSQAQCIISSVARTHRAQRERSESGTASLIE